MKNRLARRTLLASAASCSIFALGRGAIARQLNPEPKLDGDCSDVEGIDRFIALWNGNPIVPGDKYFTAIGADWELHANDQALEPNFIPRGWQSWVELATELTDDGAPIWDRFPRSGQLPVSFLAVNRVTSPDGDVVFENIQGYIAGGVLTPEQVRSIAFASLVDPSVRIQDVCLQHFDSEDFGGDAQLWSGGYRAGRNALISTGNVSSFTEPLVGTTIGIQTAIARRTALADYLEDLTPMFVECILKGGGGGDDPTPTPEL